MLTILGAYAAVVSALFLIPFVVEDFWVKLFDGAQYTPAGKTFLEWHQAEPLSGPLFALFWPHTLYRAFKLYQIRQDIKEQIALMDATEATFGPPNRWARNYGHRCELCDLDNRWHAKPAWLFAAPPAESRPEGAPPDQETALVLDLEDEQCFTRYHYTTVNPKHIFLHGKVEESLAQKLETKLLSHLFKRSLSEPKTESPTGRRR